MELFQKEILTFITKNGNQLLVSDSGMMSFVIKMSRREEII